MFCASLAQAMEARPFNPQAPELEAVLELFRTVYRSEMTPALYRWRFLESPFGAPMISLLWDGAVLAGHYAASPMRSWLNGPVASAQSMTTMTHPSYRNQGVFTDLARDLYARLTERGVKWVWGLPNTQSHYGFHAKLGWRDIALMFTMTKVLAAETGTVTLTAEPPASAGALFDRADDGRLYPARRDEAYLRWRYVANPSNRYSFVAAGDVLFVIKEYRPSPEVRALELVDYVFIRPSHFAALVRELLGWARSEGFTHVRTWIALSDPGFRELEKLGFVPKEPLAYFGGRELAPFGLDAWTHDRVAITMGDSDNY
jgi:GNAT superfamily N-acetyltransferase